MHLNRSLISKPLFSISNFPWGVLSSFHLGGLEMCSCIQLYYISFLSHKIVLVNWTNFFLIFRKCRKSSENTIRPSCNCFEWHIVMQYCPVANYHYVHNPWQNVRGTRNDKVTKYHIQTHPPPPIKQQSAGVPHIFCIIFILYTTTLYIDIVTTDITIFSFQSQGSYVLYCLLTNWNYKIPDTVNFT